MKNIVAIVLIIAFLSSCSTKQTRPELQEREASALVGGTERVDTVLPVSADTLDSNVPRRMDWDSEPDEGPDPTLAEILSRIAVIPSHIPGNNSANVISDAVTDVDGNTYDAVRIGNQVWMQRDLHTKHYRDGSKIVRGVEEYSYYNTKPLCVEAFTGTTDQYTTDKVMLYNWSAVADPRGLCPEGWHVSTKQDWDTLEAFLGADSLYVKGQNPKNIAKALSSTQWTDWVEYTKYYAAKVYTPSCRPASTNNATGFSAYPWLHFDGHHYEKIGTAYYWTSDVINKSCAWSIAIHGNSAALHKMSDGKGRFYMVRCVKGE